MQPLSSGDLAGSTIELATSLVEQAKASPASSAPSHSGVSVGTSMAPAASDRVLHARPRTISPGPEEATDAAEPLGSTKVDSGTTIAELMADTPSEAALATTRAMMQAKGLDVYAEALADLEGGSAGDVPDDAVASLAAVEAELAGLRVGGGDGDGEAGSK